MRYLHCIILALLLAPLTVTIGADVQVPVTEFHWQHDGQHVSGFVVQCNGVDVLTITTPAGRQAGIPALEPGEQECSITAINQVDIDGTTATVQSDPSESVSFFSNGANHYRLVEVAAPAVPTGFGVR